MNSWGQSWGLSWLESWGNAPSGSPGDGGGSGKKRKLTWGESPVDYSTLYEDPAVRAGRLAMRAAIHAFGAGVFR